MNRHNCSGIAFKQNNPTSFSFLNLSLCPAYEGYPVKRSKNGIYFQCIPYRLSSYAHFEKYKS